MPGGDADRALAADRVPAALGDGRRDRLVGAGKQEHELVAAVAGDLVVRAQLALQRAGDLAQQLVAGRVALGVVDALEVVEVQDHGAERMPVTARAGDLLADAQLHRAVVEDARQRVGAGDVLDVLERLRVAAGDGGEAGDRLERAQVLVLDVAAGRPRHLERAAQLVVPRDRHRHRGQQVADHRVLEFAAEQLVVGADERLAGLQHAPRGALAAVDVHPDPAVRDVVARGGDGAAVLLVDEVDTGHVRVERARGPARAASSTSASRISCRSSERPSARAARTTARSCGEPAARRSSASRRA